MKTLAALLILSCSLFGAAQVKPEIKSEQHKATYTIVMVNPLTKQGAGCSATAISEHVLLTAEHCNIEGAVLYINQPAPPRVHPLEISERYLDHQDHMLLVLPGVTFKHTVKYDPTTYKAFVQGEHYYLWGNPALIEDQYREGYVTGRVTVPPTGDEGIDATSSFLMLSGPVVGGDSGSGVFAADGRLAGVMTYGIQYGEFAGMYSLAFTPEQVAQAEGLGNYVYLPEPPKPITNVSTTVKVSHDNTLNQYLPLFLILAVLYVFPFVLTYRALRYSASCISRLVCYLVSKTKVVYRALKS